MTRSRSLEKVPTDAGGVTAVARRQFVRALAATTGVIWLQAGKAEVKPRQPKDQVAYQDTPAANGDRCQMCTFFEAPGGCKVVDGSIKPEGWCKLYEAGL